MKKLSNRLATIAFLAENYERVADVGTDHGYIPVRLLQTGKVKLVVASDINSGPLEHAKQTAAENGITEGIEFAVSDGISHLQKGDVDAIIIAGMGGETIVKILSGSDWVSDGAQKLILQPMTKIEELISWLCKNGFYISDAILAEDDGDLYLIVCAEAGHAPEPSAAGLYAPAKLLINKDPLLDRYLDMLISKLSRAAKGMKSAKEPQSPERLKHIESAIDGLKAMKGEINNWQR